MTRRISLLALLLPVAGLAYMRQQVSGATIPLVRVDQTSIRFYLNEQIAPGYQSGVAGGAVPTITSDSNPQQAVHKALDSWNAVSTANIHFLPLVLTASVIDPNDFQATIAFGSTASDLSYAGGALAITIDSYVTEPANPGPNGTLLACNSSCMYPAGAIYDSDIILNPAYSFSTTGGVGTHDLQAVMLHELGHALSANHSGLLGASMFQFPTQHFLTIDDEVFAESAYPLPVNAAPLGTISGTVQVAGGGPVPYALLTAFDTSLGFTIGGVTNPDGTYSFQVPPGNYQIYAEPLSGVVAINIYLTSSQASLAAATKFQTTLYSGGVLAVAANAAVTANITVIAGASNFAAPVVAVSQVGAGVSSGVVAGPATLPSGQSVDLILSGAGFDATLTESDFTFYGQGISVKPDTLRVDASQKFNGFPLLRLTLEIAAAAAPSLAGFIVADGLNTLAFSGALVIVPPTPTFVSAGVISAAAYAGILGGVSPGGIYSIYDIPDTPNLGPAIYVQNGPYDAYGDLATTLAGVTVTFDGVPAPMFLASGAQLNLQVPFEVAGKTSTEVIVNYLGSASATVAVPVLPTQPDFFTVPGTGNVKAYNLPGYTLNTAQTPAPRGSYVEVYGTGVGKASYTVLTGQGAPQYLPGFTGNYTYSVGGSPAAAALFGGYTPTAVGLAQWDLQIPPASAPERSRSS